MSHFPQKLADGYRNFIAGRYADESSRYRKLASEGQKPETMIIACCDSRAAPETIFDAGPGELFVVRNVANLVPAYSSQIGSSVLAAIEFAVLGLKVRNIVVMGHSRCGGIKAALDQSAQPLTPENSVGTWMSQLRQTADTVARNEQFADDERQTELERVSVRQSVANLHTFPYIDEAQKTEKLSIHGTWFDIFSGELWLMNSDSGDFERPWLD